MSDLTPAVTVYAPADVDRVLLGRLIDSLCRLNGVAAAIELHPAPPASPPMEEDPREHR